MGKRSQSIVNETKFANLMATKVTDVESVAKVMHESGRESVINNKVLKPDGAPLGEIKFLEWEGLPEAAKEGRRIQAKYFLGIYDLFLK
jgi:hypothetical protein